MGGTKLEKSRLFTGSWAGWIKSVLSEGNDGTGAKETKTLAQHKDLARQQL